MDKKNIILIVIVVLVIALAAVAAYIYTSDNSAPHNNINQTENTTVIDIDKVNNTIVGDNSSRTNDTTNITNNNTPYKVYNPQTDSYVPVIGEKYDSEVNRWYTYDEDGVRYYNTRINWF